MSIILPIFIFGYFSMYITNNKIMSETEKSYTQTTGQINSVLDEYITQIDKISLGVYSSESIPIYLQYSLKTTLSDTDMEQEQLVNAYKYLENMKQINPDIWSLSIIDLKGKAITISKNGYERKYLDFLENPYFQTLRNSYGDMVVMPLQNSKSYFANTRKIFTIGRKFLDESGASATGSYTGYIVIECGVDVLQRICGNISLGESGFVNIISNDGELMYSNALDNGFSFSQEDIDNVNNKTRDNEIVSIGGQKMFVVSNISETTDWKVVGLVPYDEITSTVKNVFNTYIVFFMVCVLMVLLASLIFSKSFLKPIKRLENSFDDFKNGNMGANVPIYSKNEFGNLSSEYNKFISEINNLTASIRIAEQRKREMEISLLFSQINPHFLYNTLDSIRMLAILGRMEETSTAIKSLADLFRYNSKQTTDFVDIKNEIIYVQNYVYLQKLRYGTRFDTIYDIEQAVLDEKTLRFTLQPIVENAILHGFAETKKDGCLKLTVKNDGDYIVFTIEDNGKGMTIEQLELLQERFVSPESGEHIGLKNINDRLKLYFGEDCCLNIESAVGKGTKVFFKTPLIFADTNKLIHILGGIKETDLEGK